jgi:hypothetical protein
LEKTKKSAREENQMGELLSSQQLIDGWMDGLMDGVL